MCGRAAANRVLLPRPKWSCLLLRIVFQDALSGVMKNYPPLKLRVFADDITVLVQGRNNEVAEMAKKVMKKLKEEVEKKNPQVVSHPGWKGRKEHEDCIVWFPGGRDASIQQRRSDDGR